MSWHIYIRDQPAGEELNRSSDIDRFNLSPRPLRSTRRDNESATCKAIENEQSLSIVCLHSALHSFIVSVRTTCFDTLHIQKAASARLDSKVPSGSFNQVRCGPYPAVLAVRAPLLLARIPTLCKRSRRPTLPLQFTMNELPRALPDSQGCCSVYLRLRERWKSINRSRREGADLRSRCLTRK